MRPSATSVCGLKLQLILNATGLKLSTFFLRPVRTVEISSCVCVCVCLTHTHTHTHFLAQLKIVVEISEGQYALAEYALDVEGKSTFVTQCCRQQHSFLFSS